VKLFPFYIFFPAHHSHHTATQAVAQSLRDLVCDFSSAYAKHNAHDFSQDLVFIEEEFERLQLDYDRVFSAMGVPACLWRRTGEIYKGNREFTELVGVDGYMMRDVGGLFTKLTLRIQAFSHPRSFLLFLFRVVCVYMSSWLRSLL
jgi:hypothetical protein